MASPLDIYADLQEEYGRLSQEELANRAAQVSSLGGALSQMKSARGSRLDPQFSALIGALGGAFRNNTSAGAEGLKAYNEAQAQLEADPVNEYNAVGGYLTKETDRITELKKALLAGMKGLKEGNGVKDRWVPTKARDGIWQTNEATGEGKWAVGPVDVFKLQADYKKGLLKHSQDLGLYGRDGWTEEAIDNESKTLANSYANGTEEQQAAIELKMRNMGTRPLNDTALVTPEPKDTSSTAALALKDIDAQLQKYGDNPRYAAPVAQLKEEKQRLTAMVNGSAVPPAYAGTPRQEASIAKMAAGTGIKDVRTNIAPGFIPPAKGVGFAPTTQQRAEDAKKITKLDEDSRAIRGSNASLMDMERLSLAADPKTGKLITSQGPASELMTGLGGWTNYFDPNGTIAKTASNNAAYFSAMQKQVASILPAYGAGTAVSNLDLIVAQMAAGSLDNTLNGRLKIIGASRAMNEAMAIIFEKQREHLANGGTMADFKLDPRKPLVGLAPVKKIIDGTTYTRYEPMTEEQFLSKFTAKYPKASVEDQQKEWYNFAMQKGAYSPDKRK